MKNQTEKPGRRAPARNIVVGIDLGDRSPLCEERREALVLFAKELARLGRLPTQLFFSAEQPRHPLADSTAESMPERLNELHARLQTLAEGSPWTCTIGAGHAVEELLRLTRDHSVELFAVAMRNTSTLGRLGLGSTTEELVRHSRRPVAILGPNAVTHFNSAPKLPVPLRLLVSTDLGRCSRPAEHYALSIAKNTGGSVTLLHNLYESYRGMEESAVQSGWVPMDFGDLITTLARKGRQALDEKAEFFRERGVACDFILDEEPRSAAQSILALQSKGYSLLVMGTRSRSGFMRTFLGSTLRSTILETIMPVIAIRA